MKTWGEMTDAEQGELLLAHHRGEVIENYGTAVGWVNAKPAWLEYMPYRVKPKETTYRGECFAYHYTSLAPRLADSHLGEDCVQGTYTVTRINGKPVKIVWEADQ